MKSVCDMSFWRSTYSEKFFKIRDILKIEENLYLNFKKLQTCFFKLKKSKVFVNGAPGLKLTVNLECKPFGSF